MQRVYGGIGMNPVGRGGGGRGRAKGANSGIPRRVAPGQPASQPAPPTHVVATSNATDHPSYTTVYTPHSTSSSRCIHSSSNSHS